MIDPNIQGVGGNTFQYASIGGGKKKKGSRKSSRKSSRKTSRKSSRKTSRKSSRKSKKTTRKCKGLFSFMNPLK
uniref:Uncharacterized protein n=1 Tax=viral metagenome TaxID=1070528 RepID=A0A6C0CNJ1_9ZZZZ